MANIKLPKKNPTCKKCNSPVKIIIPIYKFGNVHGEQWDCPNCGKDIDAIVARL